MSGNNDTVPGTAGPAQPQTPAAAVPVLPLRPATQPSENLPHDPMVDRVVGRALFVAVATACLFLLIAATAALVVGLETGGAIRPPTGTGTGLISILGARAGWAMTNLVRGAEVIATVIAALLVFLVIRARPTDALMSLLGLIVIAALIVPVAELTRIADSLRGQDRDQPESPRLPYQPVHVDPETSQIVAQRVLSDLQQNDLMRGDGSAVEGKSMVDLTEALGLALYRVEVGNVAATVRQRGHARLLLELTAQESRQNLFLSPAMNRVVREDVKALHELGVVSVVYGNLAQVQPTALGIRVLHRLFPEEARVRQIAEENRVRLYPPTGRLIEQVEQLRLQREPTNPASLLGQEVGTYVFNPAEPAGTSREVALNRPVGAGLRLRVRARGDILIEARSLSGIDPTLTIWPATGTGTEGRLGDMLASNDDWGGSRDARVLRSFEPGEYLVQVAGFGGAQGRVRLTIRPPTARDAAAERWPEEVPTDIPALRETAPGEWSEELRVGPSPGLYRRLDLAEAATYRLDTTHHGPEMDPYLLLFRQDGTEWVFVAFDDDSGDNYDARIERRLEPGTYALRVYNVRNSNDVMTLRVRRLPANGAPTRAASPPR